MAPSGSSRLICVLKGAGSVFRDGGFQKNNMKMRVNPPTGRLIQKHHLQVTPLVKAPPTKGPRTEAIPKIIPNML